MWPKLYTMSLFHSIQIKEIVRETPDAVSVVFDVPEHLKSTFNYLPGQYLTLSVNVQGSEERRAYSFSSSPLTDPFPAITVKKVNDGRVSPFVNTILKAGDMVQVMPPLGKFTWQPGTNQNKHYFLFAGGSGVTPVMSILKSILHSESESKVTLVYANRDQASIIFRELLEKLEARYASRLSVFHCLEYPYTGFGGFSGRPSKQDYRMIIRNLHHAGLETEYYICGPSGMMDMVKEALLEENTPLEKIHTEYFSAPATPKVAPAAIYLEEEDDGQESGGGTNATIFFNGNEFHITVPPGQTILEAAKDQDVDPPYACQMGVCTTCRAKLTEGSARMDEREGLSDAEIEEGYILTCQSHPTSKKITLTYE